MKLKMITALITLGVLFSCKKEEGNCECENQLWYKETSEPITSWAVDSTTIKFYSNNCKDNNKIIKSYTINGTDYKQIIKCK